MISPGVVIEFDSTSRWREDRMGECLISTSQESFRKDFDRGIIKQEFLLGIYYAKNVMKFRQTIELRSYFSVGFIEENSRSARVKMLWMSLVRHSWNSERIEIVMVCLFCVVCFRFSVSIDLGFVAICEVASGLFVLMCLFACR